MVWCGEVFGTRGRRTRKPSIFQASHTYEKRLKIVSPLFYPPSSPAQFENSNMPSSKGKPTDPKLREQVKEGKHPFSMNRKMCSTPHPVSNSSTDVSLLSLLLLSLSFSKRGQENGQGWRTRPMVSLEGR